MGVILPRSKYDSGRVAGPLQERIRRWVVVDANGCWLWQGACDSRWGYGKTFVGSRRDGSRRGAKAHIVSYQAFVGPVPAGLTLDHACNVPRCVNPEHLVPMTQRENTLKPGSRAVTALNARRTHCEQGHPLSGDNLRWRGTMRVCRTCQGWKGRIPIFEQDQVCAYCGTTYRKRYWTECCSNSCSNLLHPRRRGH